MDPSVPDIYPDDRIARRPGALLAFQMTGLILPFVAGHTDDVENVVDSIDHTGLYVSGSISGAAGSALTLYGGFDNLAGDALPLGAKSNVYLSFIEFRISATGCLDPASECAGVGDATKVATARVARPQMSRRRLVSLSSVESFGRSVRSGRRQR